MADSISLMFQAGVTFDQSQVNAAIARMAQSVQKQPPINIQSTVGNVAGVGDANRYIREIENTSKAIKNVKMEQQGYFNQAGEEYKVLSKMAVEYVDKLGDIKKVTHDLKYVVPTGHSRSSLTEQFSVPVGKQSQDVVKAYEKELVLQEQIGRKATEWGNRAESMGNKEKTAIQGVTTALQANITAYRNALIAQNPVEAGRLSGIIKQQNVELDRQIDLSKRSATGLRSWTDSIKNAIMQTVSYSLSLGLVRSAQLLLNDALRFTIDLNKEMTKIQVLQVEGAQTPEEIRALAKEFNNLGKEMGATTMEVAQGSVEWLRQGKTISETTQLLKASTMLSKLGALEAAQATDYLTSTLNSYKLGSEDAIAVVDKLIAVDNTAATSAKELATALKYSAAGASEAGVSLEQLVSYIGVVSSVTRQNAESIGQSINFL
jgi:hypothetical protein